MSRADLPAWVARGPVPPDWRYTERLVRLTRAEGRCERCGAVDGKLDRRTGIYTALRVVHRTDAETWRPEDLVAACESCIRDGRHRRAPGTADREPVQASLLEDVA